MVEITLLELDLSGARFSGQFNAPFANPETDDDESSPGESADAWPVVVAALLVGLLGVLALRWLSRGPPEPTD